MSDFSDLEEFEPPERDYANEGRRKAACTMKRQGKASLMQYDKGSRSRKASQRAHMNKDSGRVPPLRRV